MQFDERLIGLDAITVFYQPFKLYVAIEQRVDQAGALVRLGVREEDAPAVVGHADLAVACPPGGVDTHRRAQIHVGRGEVGRAKFAPPLEMVTLFVPPASGGPTLSAGLGPLKQLVPSKRTAVLGHATTVCWPVPRVRSNAVAVGTW